jgi:hypothetical protein
MSEFYLSSRVKFPKAVLVCHCGRGGLFFQGLPMTPQSERTVIGCHSGAQNRSRFNVKGA